MCRSIRMAGFVIVALASAAPASWGQCGFGGTPGSGGEIPSLEVHGAAVGMAATVTVNGISPEATAVYLVFAFEEGCIDVSDRYGPGATLRPRAVFEDSLVPPYRPSKRITLDYPRATFSKIIPEQWGGRTAHLQAFVEDPGATGGFALSNGVSALIRDADGMWAASGNLPQPLAYVTSVYDPFRNRVVFFGGQDAGQNATRSVGSFDPGRALGEQITILQDTLDPGCYAAAAVWDPVRDRAYLFGGMVGPLDMTDRIVAYDPAGPEGSRLQVLGDRLPRSLGFASAVWDPGRGVAYLFGGASVSGRRAEILEFDPDRPEGQRMVELSDSLPEGVWDAAAVWDADRGVAYLFGGNTSWVSARILEFDPSAPAGSRVRVLGPELPSGRAGASAAWDPARGVAYVIGGSGSGGRLGEVLRFDPNQTGGSIPVAAVLPVPTAGVGTALDGARDRVFLLGGITDAGRLSEITVFPPPEGPAERLRTLPTRMADTAVAHLNGIDYLFGGFDLASNSPMGGIVRFAPGAPPGDQMRVLPDLLPSTRYGCSAAADPVHDTAYVFGGIVQGLQMTDEILAFEPSLPEGSRVRVLSGRLPRAVAFSSVAWNRERGVAYLFGGADSSSARADILEFDPARPAGSRVRTLSDTLPAPRWGMSAAWDPIRGVAYLFGGYDPSGASDEIVRFDPSLPAGQRVAVLGTRLPAGRGRTSAVWDPVRDLAYVIGGDGFGGDLTEVIAFDPAPSQGQVFPLEPLPYPLSGSGSSFGPDSGTVRLFGGFDQEYGYHSSSVTVFLRD